jgi:heme/copper-type cytochrome/quinol oxidase subunit 2
MDEATKQALNAFVLQTLDIAKTASAWTAEQAPILVQEWLRWQMFAAWGWAFVFAVVTGVIATLAVFCWRQHREDPGSDYVIGATVLSVATVVPFAISVAWVFDAVKVLVAPRVVVLEKFMRFLQ